MPNIKPIDPIAIAQERSQSRTFRTMTNPADTEARSFRTIIADVRDQEFNTDAEKSADFLEFVGCRLPGSNRGGA